jgi:hypothetical protein
MERIMPTMEKFIIQNNEKSGVLPLLPLKGGIPTPTSSGSPAQSAAVLVGKGN